ncbi:MAG: glycosyltransferase family 39 protein, partial [Bdellovibrionota bacterium]
MFSKNSYLIPYYLNEPHFSKPPLQFWLTTPFYFIFGEGLWCARSAIFLITCSLIAYTSKLLSRLGSLCALNIFILFISTFGVIKYSRIYMMDAFFTFFTGAGTLFAYDYLKTKHLHSLIVSASLLAASTLVKGPISIVMAFTALLVFILIHRNREQYKAFFQLLILIIIPASLWYIACFYQFGSKFFDYFFIRENLGKLTTKAYSPFVLVQGLFLFSFPAI